MPVPAALIEEVIADLRFDAAGLIPAIAQNEAGEVLMLAWMNADAVRETLTSDRVTYYSRSRQSLWRKGETSGHVQTLRHLRYDCDADTLLLIVDQQGAACHTNRPNCFYRQVEPDGVRILSAPIH